MSTATTPEMIEAAKRIADEIKGLQHVRRSVVDDWGTFGNFSVFVDVEALPTVNLRAIGSALKAAVKKHAPKAELRSVIMPRRVFSTAYGTKSFKGWNSDGRCFPGYGQITIDLDFMHFDAGTNSFPDVQPEGPFKLGAWGVAAGHSGSRRS